ncbi:MAG: DNA polymerase III subunit beta [Saprospiraceae bacterium]
MKFTASSQELLKKLQIAHGAIGGGSVIPVLEDFLFSIQGSTLTITATDMETAITTTIQVQSEVDGKMAVPSRILMDTLKALPEQPVSFALNDEKNALEITSAYGKYKLACDNPDDYPPIPEKDGMDSVTISGLQLNRAISNSLFATSNDEMRLAMTGVFVQIDPKKITFVATDAHKLVRYSFSDIEGEATASFILPKKSLNLLKNAIPASDKVVLSHSRVNAFFQCGDTNIICRLIDATYPDYNLVIPVNNPLKMIVNRSDFQNSLKRIAIYSNKTTNQVVLTIAEGSLTISAQDLDFSNEATEQLSCQYQDTAMTIGFNAKFLVEMLGVITSDEIRLELEKPNKASILIPMDSDPAEDLLMLVMPVMLSA